MSREKRVDVVVLGAGTAGISAMNQVRDAGKSFVLINGGPLGTTCARAGCQPSKLLIQAADSFHDRTLFDEFGIRGGSELKDDIPAALVRVRGVQKFLIDRWIEDTTPAGEQFIDGYARLVAPDVVEVNDTRIRADRIVVAIGSHPVVPKPWQGFGERVLTTDTLFEQEDLPEVLARCH